MKSLQNHIQENLQVNENKVTKKVAMIDMSYNDGMEEYLKKNHIEYKYVKNMMLSGMAHELYKFTGSEKDLAAMIDKFRVVDLSEYLYQSKDSFKIGDNIEVRNANMGSPKNKPFTILETGKIQAISTFNKTPEMQKHYSDIPEEDQPDNDSMTVKVNGHWYVEDDVTQFVKQTK